MARTAERGGIGYLPYTDLMYNCDIRLNIGKDIMYNVEDIRYWLNYDPETGLITWKRDKCRVKAGDVAGKIYTGEAGKSYRQIKLNQKLMMAHRVAFLHYYGWLPEEIDHINGDGTDNRISNLRAANRLINGKNTRRSTSNTSGCTGVSWDKKNNRWYAYIKVNQKMKNLGRYKDKEQAIKVRKEAEKLYGFHENHGEDRPL